MGRTLAIAAALMLSGCVTTPGQTLRVLSYTPSMVVYEYTRWYRGELESAMANAQNYCQQFGKNAVVGSTMPAGPNPIDRVVTTFNCVA